MECFEGAKTVRLLGHHGKYLYADEDQINVSQNRDVGSEMVIWHVEHIHNTTKIRLKSCYHGYLAASDSPFLFGMTGKKVLQSKPSKLDSSLEWEPVKQGVMVKLKAYNGNFLRANGTVPPYRNSVTHDVPLRSATKDWVLWEVEVVEKVTQSIPTVAAIPVESFNSFSRQSLKPEGRLIFCKVADDLGNDEPQSFRFVGSSLQMLILKLKEELNLDEDFIVCGCIPGTRKLYPLKLELPPNTAPMHITVVKASSPEFEDLRI